MFDLNGKYAAARIFTDNIENEAISQIYELCNQEFIKDCKVRIMPDVHAGKGCTIGTTIEIKDKVVPNLVGVDISCGVLCIKLKEKEIDFKKFNLHFNLQFTETYGFITKEVRQYLNLPKEHYFDGVAICYCDKINENKIFFKTNSVQLKKCVNKGNYKRQKFIRGKMVNLPRTKIQGFKKI